jgi:hypothetical protein
VLQVRALDISTALYTFGAFIGAFTILVEVVLAVARFWFPDSKGAYLITEIIGNALLWIFWLGSSRSDVSPAFLSLQLITRDNKDARSICSNLDQIALLPELQPLGPEFLGKSRAQIRPPYVWCSPLTRSPEPCLQRFSRKL